MAGPSYPSTSELLIIGAGPYGLSTAAYARHRGVEPVVLGDPMGFWRHGMPAGMFLRSGIDWHMDPLGIHTLARYLEGRGIVPAAARAQRAPLPLSLFQAYARWFQERKELAPLPGWVCRLRRRDGGFEAELEGGERIRAARVVVAPGFGPFAHVPADLAALMPAGRWSHTCHTPRFDFLRGRRCLIVGGRQSAFEGAALVREAGAAAVHVVHRHPTPAFAESDWSWVAGMLAATQETHGWFRRLPPEERAAVQRRFWSEGRLKLEPWLAPRLAHPEITLWPEANVAACETTSAGDLQVTLDTGAALAADHVLLATGYRVQAERLAYLAELLPGLATDDGFPVLDEGFQSTAAGLYFTSTTATQAFGPFFGFVAGCPTAARILVDGMVA